ncbi:MAG: metallophosphoesterase [Victivallaceae bacterium]|nr:metallophosphoesterase [Victivallaceae bacterium]
MARIAVLSDIHSNADAFEAVLEKCGDLSIDYFVCLGDIVGYNAEPSRCIAMVRELEPKAFAIGNHDYYAIMGNTELSGFNELARTAVEWTRDQLSPEEAEYLRRPDSSMVSGTGCSIVHATMDTPRNWGYITARHHAEAHFSYQLTPVCFCGHSHIPIAFEKQPMSLDGNNGVVELRDWVHSAESEEYDTNFELEDELTVVYRPGRKYLFNIGSIGQPRNGDPRASFAMIDTVAKTVTRYRIPYDIGWAQQKVIDAGLPENLAYRLATGI